METWTRPIISQINWNAINQSQSRTEPVRSLRSRSDDLHKRKKPRFVRAFFGFSFWEKRTMRQNTEDNNVKKGSGKTTDCDWYKNKNLSSNSRKF